jgi:hypothetical protein
VTLVVLPDGRVLLPRGEAFLLAIAKELGDERAITFCEQASCCDLVTGKRMCG